LTPCSSCPTCESSPKKTVSGRSERVCVHFVPLFAERLDCRNEIVRRLEVTLSQYTAADDTKPEFDLVNTTARNSGCTASTCEMSKTGPPFYREPRARPGDRRPPGLRGAAGILGQGREMAGQSRVNPNAAIRLRPGWRAAAPD
jgi:hypothetical protein